MQIWSIDGANQYLRKFEWRKDLYDDDVAGVLDEKPRSGAIDSASEFTREMVGTNLPRAMDHPDMTVELAEILSTNTITIEYRIETNIRINE